MIGLKKSSTTGEALEALSGQSPHPATPWEELPAKCPVLTVFTAPSTRTIGESEDFLQNCLLSKPINKTAKNAALNFHVGTDSKPRNNLLQKKKKLSTRW
jgi:hypothetical protein